jgi:hypothetical protein
LGLLENAIKLSSNLIVDGAPENEVLIYLSLMKMAKLVDPILSSDVVVDFYLKMMRSNPKLPKWDLEGMHIVLKCVGSLNNNAISQLRKVLCIEGHLGAYPT